MDTTLLSTTTTSPTQAFFLWVLSKLSKLEQLEELNLSGNKLKTIPSTVSSCKRLHTLLAHSNHITVFPEILNLPEIKVRYAFAIISSINCVCDFHLDVDAPPFPLYPICS